ncbi:NACHT, LRR and PYD domains-containing 12-like [Pelobates cultripes]|uniref:NACHT, LRR and PYD domains-containing 12-like n=1 Tax=Pelobates cultripes TaxID=61616 RepID=A0AAD1WSM3_PELCU|nr:NACHT, LRR and PYD domains-containing 12-like [Pelobates cultripes]
MDEEFRGRVVTNEELELFCMQLAEYEMHHHCSLYKYFFNDLVYIVETLDSTRILSELNYRNIVDMEYYVSLKKQCGDSVFSVMLIQDIFDLGKEAVIGLWGSLFAIQNDYPHPNLLGVLDEISRLGPLLLDQINLDENGVALPKDLKDIQDVHRQNLLGKTQQLVEHQAPGLSHPQQSFQISDRYLDLIVVSTKQFRTRNQHEVIDTGGVHEHYLQATHIKLERISPNKLFRWCHRSSCLPHSVLVGGVPGVGKTTLMQKFVFDWVRGELYQRFSFVFFFKFRMLNDIKELSLVDLILKEYPYLTTKLETLFSDPANLLFIFDGLDESVQQMDFRSERLCTSPQIQESLSVLVVSLVKQSLLKGCYILITSRPTKLALIETKNFQRVSEIMGFFPKERKLYFDKFFLDEKKSEMAFNYVRENGILYTFCYIPSYCWILCTVLSTCFKPQEMYFELLPKTVTQLFVTFFANILTNHSRDTSQVPALLTSLGWMAEYGVMEHVLGFESCNLKTFGVNYSSQLLSNFMVESGQGPNVTVSFFHLTIQEFLAALVHYLDYSHEKLQESLDKARRFEDGRGEMFLRFLCGLSDSNTRAVLQKHLGNFSPKTSVDVINWLSNTFSMNVRPDRESDDKRKILNMFASLFESRNRALVAHCLGANKKFQFPEFHLAPLDCTVLAFILECCRDPELVDLDTCFIQTEGLERLYTILHNVVELRLTNNDLKDTDMKFIYRILTNPACKIQNLSLKDNSFTEECCPTLAAALCENQSLRTLDLSKNKLGGPELENLLNVLSDNACKIGNLSLRATKLTHEHAPLLVSLSGNTNLTHLNLSFNYFADTGSEYIYELIRKSTSLREIRLDTNDFNMESIERLRSLQKYHPNLNIIL